MATIKCSECGGVVSTSAKTCPHCGASAKVFKRTPIPPGTTPTSVKVASGVIILLLIMLAHGMINDYNSISNLETTSASSQKTSSAKNSNASNISISSNSAEFSTEELCKAAISLDLFRPINIIHTIKSGNIPEVRYTREDGDTFTFRCKLSGNRIVWSTYFTETKSWGRWRDDEQDPKLTYNIVNGKLKVSSSESGITQEFIKSDF